MLATPAQDSWDILEGLAAVIPGATCPRYDTRWEGISNPCRHHTEAIQLSWPKQPLGPSVQEVLSVKWLKQNGVKCSKLGVCRPSRLYKGETPRRRSVLETCAGLMPYRQVGESFARALGWQKVCQKEMVQMNNCLVVQTHRKKWLSIGILPNRGWQWKWCTTTSQKTSLHPPKFNMEPQIGHIW